MEFIAENVKIKRREIIVKGSLKYENVVIEVDLRSSGNTLSFTNQMIANSILEKLVSVSPSKPSKTSKSKP